MENSATKIAAMLLDINAIQINMQKPFIWASGWHSPIYCDNRLSLSHPKVRTYIKSQIIETIQTAFCEAEAVVGVATAGIPQAAIVAEEMEVPMLYVRPKPKGHGLTNLIEGNVVAGQKVIVIEDLISTGGSSVKAIQALREAGCNVLGLISIFTYGFPVSYSNFEKANIKFIPLTDYPTLLNVALSENRINEKEIASLGEWREKPEAWGR